MHACICHDKALLASGCGPLLHIHPSTACRSEFPGRLDRGYWTDTLELVPAQVAPYDFLVADEVLSEGEVAAARRKAAMWLADGMYAMLPYSSLLLESVPDLDSLPTSRSPTAASAAAPASVIAARCAQRTHITRWHDHRDVPYGRLCRCDHSDVNLSFGASMNSPILSPTAA